MSAWVKRGKCVPENNSVGSNGFLLFVPPNNNRVCVFQTAQ